LIDRVRRKPDTPYCQITGAWLRIARGVRLQPDLRLIAIVVLLLVSTSIVPPRAHAQLAGSADDRFAGLQWRFVRIRYHFITENTTAGQDYAGEPWYIDAPAAEQNLSRRVKSATTIQVEDPIVLTLDDPRLFTYPWIYVVEVGNLKLSDADVATLREFMLRGGTVTFDDFHGPIEWANMEEQMKRVFPDRPIVEIPKGHPVFSAFYKIDEYPQVAGLGSYLDGRSWEKGGIVPHLRTILDDNGRPMMFINWNTDMGDGWEWSNAVDFPDYVKYTALAYRMGINEIMYSLTH
jgi:hypothetical protein